MSQADIGGRLVRWALKLEAFSFEINHRKGNQNVVRDAFSRTYSDTIEELETVQMDYVPHIDLSSSAFNDTDYSELRSKILTNKNKYHDVEVRSDLTYYRTEHYADDGEQQDLSWELVVPEGLRDGIMRNVHNNPFSAHGGIAKIAEHIWRFFF